jgi:hypothetical protein
MNTHRTSLLNGLLFPLALALAVPAAAEARREPQAGPAESAARQDWRQAETRRKSSEGPAEPASRQGLWVVSASLQSSRRVASELALQSAQRRLV